MAFMTAEQLRKIADQLDAYSALMAAGADHINSGAVVTVDGARLGYLNWWEDQQCYTFEMTSFTPGGAAGDKLDYRKEIIV